MEEIIGRVIKIDAPAIIAGKKANEKVTILVEVDNTFEEVCSILSTKEGTKNVYKMHQVILTDGGV